MYVRMPEGYPGNERDWLDQLRSIEREYRELAAELRMYCFREPVSDEDEYVTRRVTELCRWNGWLLRS